jgi:hypothetical protein
MKRVIEALDVFRPEMQETCHKAVWLIGMSDGQLNYHARPVSPVHD